jgi:hypothetical protein
VLQVHVLAARFHSALSCASPGRAKHGSNR